MIGDPNPLASWWEKVRGNESKSLYESRLVWKRVIQPPNAKPFPNSIHKGGKNKSLANRVAKACQPSITCFAREAR